MQNRPKRVMFFGLVSSGLGLGALMLALFWPNHSDGRSDALVQGIPLHYISRVQEGLGLAFGVVCVASGVLLIVLAVGSLLYGSTVKRQWSFALLVATAGLMVVAALNIVAALVWLTPRALISSPLTISRTVSQMQSQPLGLLLLPSIVFAALATASALRRPGGALRATPIS